jgi:hypothetical protein
MTGSGGHRVRRGISARALAPVVTGSSAFVDDDSGELSASRFREGNISLRTIRGLKETARPVPDGSAGIAIFSGSSTASFVPPIIP